MTKLKELYLIRHGIAEDAGLGQPDELRALTDEGIAHLHREADGLVAFKVAWDVILTSGLVRARQTAEVLAGHMKSEAPVVRTAALEPTGSVAAVFAELERHGKAASIALVGHEPGMGTLAAHLLGAPQAIPFKKGGICRIDLSGPASRGAGVLRWLAPPRMLRRLGR